MAVERVPVRIFDESLDASRVVAKRIATLIRSRARQGKQTVLGVATGHTPIEVYRELIRLHAEEGLDLSGVITFNLDEYWPMTPDAMQSYHRWMFENYFNHVNIPKENIHIPDGTVHEEQLTNYCRSYEQAIADAGGIDLQLLGLGSTGHIGFNEPGSSRDSITRLVALDRITRMDAATDFFSEENVPRQAMTMGIATILAAREICVLAFGEHKAEALRRAVEDPPSKATAATFLQDHPNTTFYVDVAAAAALTRTATPWVLGPCRWDDTLTRKAVVWLSKITEKAILTLTEADYAENHLHGLLATGKKVSDVNLQVFRQMMNTITGWPCGKEEGKKVLVFSPHPDDDVISMGATLAKLCHQGHQVHIAYQTDGNIAVFDHAALRQADFVRGFNRIFDLDPTETDKIEDHIEQFLRNKKPGNVDCSEVRAVKTLIRKTEAIAAAEYCGVRREYCHFLDMPFYQTGMVQKRSIGEQDVKVVLNILSEVQPDTVFAAGDLSDPHGTHRMCLEAVLRALRQYEMKYGILPTVWLYRGAWQEWEPHEIDMAIPVSPDELYHKRHAIFRHESQKDRAMFPGPYDRREFWQRAEGRNRETANIYDRLGLPEYHGLEAFVRWCPEDDE